MWCKKQKGNEKQEQLAGAASRHRCDDDEGPDRGIIVLL